MSNTNWNNNETCDWDLSNDRGWGSIDDDDWSTTTADGGNSRTTLTNESVVRRDSKLENNGHNRRSRKNS